MSQFTSDFSQKDDKTPNTCTEVHLLIGELSTCIADMRSSQAEIIQMTKDVKEKLDSFSWFIDKINGLRTSIFWGAIQLFLIGATVTIAVVNGESIIKRIRMWWGG